MVDFDWYRSFVAVYRSGTVSSAAGTRALTQPAVSQHLAALETKLGQTLFVRAPRRMLPTDYAKVLYNRVAPAIDILEQSSNVLDSPPELSLKLGAAHDYFHATALAHLAKTSLSMRVEFDLTENLTTKLERAELDVIIATQVNPARGLEYEHIDRENFLLVCHPSLRVPRLFAKKASTLQAEQWLTQQKWLSYSADMPIIRRFWHQIFKHRPSFQPWMTIPSLHSIRRAVELGYGISVLPDYLCQKAIDAKRLRIIGHFAPVTNNIWLAYRKVDRQRPAIVHLRTLLQRSA